MYSDIPVLPSHNKIDDVVILLNRAVDQGVTVVMHDGKVRLAFAKDKKPESTLINDLRKSKQEILAFLKQQETLPTPALKISTDKRAGLKKIPLSFSQERLWFIDKFEGSVHYHVPYVLRMKGHLDTSALHDALQEVVNRHEVLRTTFREENGQAWQHVLPKDRWQLRIINTLLTADEGELKKTIAEEIAQPFDLVNDHTLRASLLHITKYEHVVVLVLHHIASDGWSMPIFVHELLCCYEAAKNNISHGLAPLPIQYADYAIWQQENLQQGILDRKLDYWYEKLRDPPTLALPTDYPRPAVQSTNGAVRHYQLDSLLARQIAVFSSEQNATLFMVMLAAFKVVLYKYTGQSDICVGTPIANRTFSEVESLIGFFVNTLALRSHLAGNLTFSTFLEQVRATTLEAYDHQDVPFERIVDRVISHRDMSHSPLFQVMFVLQNNAQLEQPKIEGIELSAISMANTNAKFDLTVDVTETGNELVVDIEYCTDLFEEATIDRLFSHYQTLLRGIVNFPEKHINSLAILSDKEKQRLTEELSGEALSLEPSLTVVEVFETQVALSSTRNAVFFEEETISYEELDRRANQLANYLIAQGIGTTSLVGLCMERSLEVMVAVFGVLKSGGAYVPIDPNYPKDRREYILKDANVAMVLTNKATRQVVSGHDRRCQVPVVCIDTMQSIIGTYPTTKPPLKVTQNDLAYVIYTSGSTGNPKGVMVEHLSLLNVSLSWRHHYRLQEEQLVLLSYANVAFDVFTGDYCRALLNGGSMIIVAEDTRHDMEHLYQQISQHAVTIFEFSPLVLKALIEYAKGAQVTMPSLKTVIVGGDICSVKDYQAFRAYLGEHVRVINSYGLTEVAIDSSYFEGELSRSSYARGAVPVGKPLHNTQYYVVGSDNQLNPVGVAGELWIASKGVARGYLNRSDLTSQRFSNDPFSVNEQRLYKTGDIARWLTDGNLEFIGREDNQVKLNGFRIELNEIEHTILSVLGVESCTVQVTETSAGAKLLVGYTVGQASSDGGIWQNQLKDRLPHYMIPKYWIALKVLPRTANGKVDKSALPKPNTSEYKSDNIVSPATREEKDIASIWKYVLNVGAVSINDNFFELGGNSILSIRVISQLKMLGYQISPKDLFQYQTVEALSRFLCEKRAALSRSQERLESVEVATPVERGMMGIWKTLFVTDSISTEHNFFELGGYFLLALRMIGKIKKEFGVNLDVSVLLTHPTLKALSAYVETHPKQVDTPRLVPIGCTHHNPLFCVPGIEGSILEFYPLSQKIHPRAKVYAFQPFGIDGKSEVPSTIEEMASAYIREMRMVDSAGPYRLGGYSFGGQVVFEMALQLTRAGFEVSELIILDGEAPSSRPPVEDNEVVLEEMTKMVAAAHQKEYRAKAHCLKDKSLADQIEITYQYLTQLEIDIPDDYIRGMLEVMITHKNIRYMPKNVKLEVPVTLFKATGNANNKHPLAARPSDYGWQNFFKPKVKVFEVPGTHWTFLKYPNIKQVARHLV